MLCFVVDRCISFVFHTNVHEALLYFHCSYVHVISTCTATKILCALPDNVCDVNCPSQPCATVDQYLLDNVLSDVEYYLLPGEHHNIQVMDNY